MKTLQKLEDITSKEFLDNALENAKLWCQDNLSKYLLGFQNGVDYRIFYYIIDNEMLGSDMRLDENQHGLIRVSISKLNWYQEREDYFREKRIPRYYKKERELIKIDGVVEIDPESMFVHEITEFIVANPELFDSAIYSLEYFFGAHEIAYKIENINRRERGLKDWPKY